MCLYVCMGVFLGRVSHRTCKLQSRLGWLDKVACLSAYPVLCSQVDILLPGFQVSSADLNLGPHVIQQELDLLSHLPSLDFFSSCGKLSQSCLLPSENTQCIAILYGHPLLSQQLPLS